MKSNTNTRYVPLYLPPWPDFLSDVEVRIFKKRIHSLILVGSIFISLSIDKFFNLGIPAYLCSLVIFCAVHDILLDIIVNKKVSKWVDAVVANLEAGKGPQDKRTIKRYIDQIHLLNTIFRA